MNPDLSVVVPAHNEEECIESTLEDLCKTLEKEAIDYEVIVSNDHSTDSTGKILDDLCKKNPRIKHIENTKPNGFGFAVRSGFEQADGEWIAVMMADASDDPRDLVNFYLEGTQKETDAVFGHRFASGGNVVDYPTLKLFLNRLTNWIICLLFAIGYSDVTNAFKLYRRSTLLGLEPLLSPHFNLTVELPLKVIVRGFSYSVIPNSWYNRKTGVSKLKIKEMGSRYWFIILYCLVEKWLSVGDFRKGI
tara:strand:- start:237 stop:980 length:744 start_codon:yes stop_codon:yes gene_type:complete